MDICGEKHKYGGRLGLLGGNRGAVRRGTSDRDRSRKRRAGGFSSRWSDDDDVADDLPSASWQVQACSPARNFEMRRAIFPLHACMLSPMLLRKL